MQKWFFLMNESEFSISGHDKMMLSICLQRDTLNFRTLRFTSLPVNQIRTLSFVHVHLSLIFKVYEPLFI